VDIYQGEDDDIRHNHRVGRFLIQGLAKVPAGNQLVVQCNLDLDGMLKVTAREKGTGLQKQVTIENPFANYEREERAVAQQRLQRLWDHSAPAAGEDDDGEEGYEIDTGDLELTSPPELVPGPREGQRESVQAKALLEKAERLLPSLPDQDRAEIERLMTAVRNNLTDRRWDELPASCDALTDVLFYLEDA
jgi:molecular chaperone DnaK